MIYDKHRYHDVNDENGGAFLFLRRQKLQDV